MPPPLTVKIARLRTRLKGFVKADAQSGYEGHLEPGDYAVLDTAIGARDDYARLEVPILGAGDTWICSRSGATTYADLLDVEKPAPAKRDDFAREALAIDEANLTALFSAFEHFTYDYDDAHYPWPLPGTSVPMKKRQNNCCTFVEALTVKAFRDVHGDALAWDMRRHRQMMITATDDRFSPVTAAIESGMAVPAPGPDASPHPWSIVQGWRRQWDGGHTFLVVDHDAASDRVLILESNSSYGLNGPGYRHFGPLKDHLGGAPARWHENPECWTWRYVCSTYRFRQHAALKVKNRSLSRL